MLSRQGSDLRIALSGAAEWLTVRSWYSGAAYRIETLRTAEGQVLLGTQVEQLIQAMASFCASAGLTWAQAIAQRPEEVQAILAAYWQPAAA